MAHEFLGDTRNINVCFKIVLEIQYFLVTMHTFNFNIYGTVKPFLNIAKCTVNKGSSLPTLIS